MKFVLVIENIMHLFLKSTIRLGNNLKRKKNCFLNEKFVSELKFVLKS